MRLRKTCQLMGRTYATGASLRKRSERWLVWLCRVDDREPFADEVTPLVGLLDALAVALRLPKLLTALSERGIHGK